MVRIYIACDKGNKKDILHFVKYLTYCTLKDDCVKKVRLNVDVALGASKACTKAINHSLKNIDKPEQTRKLDGRCTDAGGGGTGECFKQELSKLY